MPVPLQPRTTGAPVTRRTISSASPARACASPVTNTSATSARSTPHRSIACRDASRARTSAVPPTARPVPAEIMFGLYHPGYRFRLVETRIGGPARRITMKPITDVHELFRHQRAIRSFTDENVPDELVNRILTAAIHGPSGSNTQPWHFIVIRDPAVKQAISEAYEEARAAAYPDRTPAATRSEEHTSELQSLRHLVCR